MKRSAVASPGMAKPHPAIYHHALGLANDPPRETVRDRRRPRHRRVLGAARNGPRLPYVTVAAYRAGIGSPCRISFAAGHDLGTGARSESLLHDRLGAGSRRVPSPPFFRQWSIELGEVIKRIS
jgi:hypothetical protein